jgi:hypothetical protein
MSLDLGHSQQGSRQRGESMNGPLWTCTNAAPATVARSTRCALRACGIPDVYMCRRVLGRNSLLAPVFSSSCRPPL